MKKSFVIIFVVMLILSSVCSAEDLNKRMDKFYAGLADIIESNMDDSAQCVREVDKYYEKNQSNIKEMRKEMAKGVEQAASMMKAMRKEAEDADGSGNMEQWARDMQKMSQEMQRDKAAYQAPGAERYAKAMQKFTMRHFQDGLKIAGKAVQLAPDFDAIEQAR